MDSTIRPNSKCVIDLPSCGYVFSSQRSCFIAFGFANSALEMQIISSVLEEKGIEAINAASMSAPGRNVFCHKICSKIITSRFCIALLKGDQTASGYQHNPNVYMELGLMLGFNKYIIPLQKEGTVLPFNISGLDIVFYSDRNLRDVALNAIHRAIEETEIKGSIDSDDLNKRLGLFLFTKNLLLCKIDNSEEKAMYSFGEYLGFNLLISFSGMSYSYFGNFTMLDSVAITWRLRKLIEILNERRSSIPQRIALATMDIAHQANLAEVIFSTMKFIIVVNDDNIKNSLLTNEIVRETQYSAASISIFTKNEIERITQTVI